MFAVPTRHPDQAGSYNFVERGWTNCSAIATLKKWQPTGIDRKGDFLVFDVKVKYDVGFFDININGTPYDLEVYGSPATFSILNNSIISFAAGSVTGKVISITVTNASDGNAVLDTVTLTITGDEECFLTTAVVTHMGGLDNGPELTAMRQLREYYIGVPGYADLIQEYYQTSPAIITAINALADPSVEYTYIYNTVVAVMNHVNGGEWQQAHDLYMAMYTDLKTRYLG